MTDSSESHINDSEHPESAKRQQLNDAWFDSLPPILKQSLQNIPLASRYFVALSGGLDSSLLLLLASRYLAEFRQQSVTAIHVHHGLSDHADQWQAHCQALCDQLGVELIARKVILTHQKKGIEEAARSARYEVFEQLLTDDAVLLQGHHQNDQAETVLLRLMRGAGAKGIASIPPRRALNEAWIDRPFLSVPRSVLLETANDVHLEWIEDESNSSLDFDRNYLRHEIVPKLEARWKGAVGRLATSAAHCRESAALEDALAEIDLTNVRQGGVNDGLSIESLNALPVIRQRNVVRYWLQQQGVGFPGEKNFKRIWTELLEARDDANPVIAWSQGCIRRYQGVVFALTLHETAHQNTAMTEIIVDASKVTVESGVFYQSDLAGKCYSLCVVHCQAHSHLMESQEQEGCLRLPLKGEQISIRFRQGGEIFKPVGSKHHRTLKKWLQMHNIPPWLRDSIPLLYYNERLVAVGDQWLMDGFQCKQGAEGIEIKWC